jgi:transcriptional regulator with XRE-family HTH domain
MKISSSLADSAVLHELGTRVARARLERNLTQRELATLSGLDRKAVQRIEAGETVTLTTLVRILRTLGLADRLDRVLPEATPSPVELVELQRRGRRRASGRRRRGRRDADDTVPWQWGDDPPAAHT